MNYGPACMIVQLPPISDLSYLTSGRYSLYKQAVVPIVPQFLNFSPPAPLLFSRVNDWFWRFFSKSPEAGDQIIPVAYK